MLLLKKSGLPVSVNSLPKDHYAQRTGQNFQERGINFFFPTRLQRENAMIIIHVTIRYTLPTSLRTANAVIIINVAIGYILPTRLH